MSISTQMYAESLIQTGFEPEIVMQNLNTVKEIIESSTELQDAIKNPSIKIDTKFEIIDEIFKTHIDEKIINFLKILVSKDRFSELNGIIDAYSNKTDEINNIKRAEVISAIELSDEQKQKIVDKLQNKLQKTVIPTWNTNEDIIGGLVIKIDDDVIDNSLKNKLERISKV